MKSYYYQPEVSILLDFAVSWKTGLFHWTFARPLTNEASPIIPCWKSSAICRHLENSTPHFAEEKTPLRFLSEMFPDLWSKEKQSLANMEAVRAFNNEVSSTWRYVYWYFTFLLSCRSFDKHAGLGEPWVLGGALW
jgi:hypothetical protein